jgi:hypothetical protein
MDIEVKISANGEVDIFWNQETVIAPLHKRGTVESKTNQGHGMPVPIGCSPEQFAWAPTYGFEVPLSHSVLVTHPLNRFDLPFITTSGIMETKSMSVSAGQVPFFVKKGFDGFIPKGTPFAQVIPFKREDWESEFLTGDAIKGQDKGMHLRDSYIENFYGRFIRQPKNFK